MMHVAEFGLDLLDPEAFKNQAMYDRALLELAHRVRCTFNLSNGSDQGFWSATITRH
jgi:hypothetical protein